MYPREEVKAITDKVIDMAKAETVEVEFNGGERSATRFANSNITANMVQFDRNVAITVHVGNKAGTATVRDFDDATLKQAVADAIKRAGEARESQDAPVLLGPQEYEPVDAALPSGVNYGPAERAKAVRQSLDICAKKGVLGSGYIPKVYQTTCSANSKGLFAYYQYAEASFILTARTKDGGGSGWAGITGVKDTSLIDPVQLTETAADKALKSQKPRALEPGRYTVILEPRPAARFLSLMLGLFTARTAEGAVGNYFSGKERGTTKVAGWRAGRRPPPRPRSRGQGLVRSPGHRLSDLVVVPDEHEGQSGPDFLPNRRIRGSERIGVGHYLPDRPSPAPSQEARPPPGLGSASPGPQSENDPYWAVGWDVVTAADELPGDAESWGKLPPPSAAMTRIISATSKRSS